MSTRLKKFEGQEEGRWVEMGGAMGGYRTVSEGCQRKRRGEDAVGRAGQPPSPGVSPRAVHSPVPCQGQETALASLCCVPQTAFCPVS